MLFVIFCTDKPDHGHLRGENRPAHIDFLKAKGAEIAFAGPTVTEDGSAMTGSMIVAEFAGQADAESWAAQDPYAGAGLFESVVIRPWKQVIPTP